MGRDAKIHTHVPLGSRYDLTEICISSFFFLSPTAPTLGIGHEHRLCSHPGPGPTSLTVPMYFSNCPLHICIQVTAPAVSWPASLPFPLWIPKEGVFLALAENISLTPKSFRAPAHNMCLCHLLYVYPIKSGILFFWLPGYVLQLDTPDIAWRSNSCVIVL